MTDAIRTVVDLVRGHTATPVVVGIAGGVAAGKSTFADGLAAALSGSRAEVVSTDGFLLPNSVLNERGLLARKGFPETYDVERLRAFVEAARRGDWPLRVPVYSHDVYDILPGEAREVAAAAVLIIEGVNALSALGDVLDVAVYLEADDADVEAWYVARFHELREAARDDPTSFYVGFASMTDDEVSEVARQVWRGINAVNLREHIEPSRRHAHVIVSKAADHGVRSVTVRAPEGDSRAV